MNDQMASAVVEIRAITTEPEILAGVLDMHGVVISLRERIVGNDFVVRCTLTDINEKSRYLSCIVNVRPIGNKQGAELQYMLRRVCNHIKRQANIKNLEVTVSHSTYDLYVAQGTKHVKERKTVCPYRRKHSAYATPAAI